MTVRWRTEVPTTSRVDFGHEDPGNLPQHFADSAETTEHCITLTGLVPETRYFYSISSATVRLAGGDSAHFFHTSPMPGSDSPVHVWIIGDAGTGGDGSGRAEAVRDAYLNSAFGATHADLWLMLGDNAYDVGTDAEYQRAVFDIYQELLPNTVLWPTFGNHDWYSEAGAPYFSIFTLPTAGQAGGIPSGTEHFYAFDYANIHFVCLDSQDSLRTPGSPMLAWLESDLAATTQKWIVAFWHHPPYTKGSHDSDWEAELVEMREHVLPILEAGGVDLVLTGHSHSYERSCLLDGHYGPSDTLTAAMKLDAGDGRETGDGAYGKDPVPHAGAIYTVVGCSGKVSGGPLNHPAMITSLSILGSAVLDVAGDRLDLRFLDSEGAVADHVTLSKAPLVALSTLQPILHEEGALAGSITLSRTRGLDQSLQIALTLDGTATPGADFKAIGTSFTLRAGAASLTVPVTPEPDQLSEGTECIRFRLAPVAGYRIHRDTGTALLALKDLPRDAWRFKKFGTDANTAAIAGDAADPDGDGHPNGVEYVAGTEPRDAASFFYASVLHEADGAVRIHFVAQPGKSYTIQAKDRLADRKWQKLTDIPATSEPHEVEASDPGASATPNRFYRVVTPAVR